jgi:hypothetical protein
MSSSIGEIKKFHATKVDTMITGTWLHKSFLDMSKNFIETWHEVLHKL